MDFSVDKAIELTDFCKSFETIESLIDSERGYECYLNLNFIICKKIFDRENFKKACEQKAYYELFTRILCTSASNSHQLDFKNVRHISDNEILKETSQNERKIYFLIHTLNLINFLVSSVKFRTILIEQNGLKSLLNLLDDHEFLENLIKFDFGHATVIVFDINWLSKLADENKSVWQDLNASQILTKYIKKYELVRLYALMALSNIADDRDLENLKEFNIAIEILTKMAFVCVFESKMTNEQEFKYGDEMYKFSVKSMFDLANNCVQSITGVLLVLYKISINPTRKLEIYQQPRLNDVLFALIYDGNEAEQQHALELLTQLCYDKTVFADMQVNTQLNEFIHKLSNSENVKYKKLIETCNQFLWLFKKDQETKTSNESHIMISYNTASRDLCLKIKNFLENNNYKVWIDVNDICGSSLDSMARAVEDAQVVLMCVTEKYRQSLNCRSEAQYAFKLNKPIIPCIMQKGLSSVDGWLGFIIGDKIFVDFTKYELNDCLKRVLDQITLMKVNSEKSESKSIKTEPLIVNQTSLKSNSDQHEVYSWDESKTEKWFIDNSFDDVLNVLKPINGKYLYQLYQLQIHTPEFFYKSLTSEFSIKIKHIMHFSAVLKELFEQKKE